MKRPVVSLVVKRRIELPSKMISHQRFAKAILKIHRELMSRQQKNKHQTDYLISSAYYLLGWLVGDAGKHFGSKRLISARVSLELCRGHPENLKLGDYVMACIRRLGVQWKRRPDQLPTKKEPHGAFFWQSDFSAIIGWLHVVCLGLKWDERTTSNPVKMDWLLTAPKKYRVWFLRGLADSDGCVEFNNRVVGIITSPNGKLVKNIFTSLRVHYHTRWSKDCTMVEISLKDAARIQIFNPHITTHRSKALKKLVSARTFQRHWPPWLEAKVQRLLQEGLEPAALSHRIYEQDNAFVKIRTVRRKAKVLHAKMKATAVI